MKTKGKRVLKNGTIGAYVYYPTDKKWKWRFIGKAKKKGGGDNEQTGVGKKREHEKLMKHVYWVEEMGHDPDEFRLHKGTLQEFHDFEPADYASAYLVSEEVYRRYLSYLYQMEKERWGNNL